MKSYPHGGRRFLLARPGQPPFHKPKPCYLMTEQEGRDAIAYWHALYDRGMELREMPVRPTCEHDHPYNSSHCEFPHGHVGQCGYHESRQRQLVRWTPGEAINSTP